MSHLGSWAIDDLMTFAANTHSAATGAATDADAVPDYRVYEDETGTAILTGSMAKLDDANTTGFYSERITLSAANGFELGKSYTIYISAAVSSVTGTMNHNFQIGSRVNISHAAGTAWASGAITAASIATGAIDADAIADNAIDAGAIASGAITSAKFAAGAIDATAIATGAIDADALAADAGTEIGTAVWATATRSLTVLDEDSTTLDLDATIRSAVGLSSANLDTQLDALPTAAENTTSLLDTAAGVETNRTVRQALRLILSALAGKLSGAATTTIAIRDTNDTVTRISATVDSDGNRSAVTLDAS
jgi:hypothetical protein